VDQTPFPFGNTRRLITRSDVKNDPKRAHTTVVPGGTAVKDSEGRYIHENVWKYLFLHPVEETGKAVEMDADCVMEPKK
jgi:hypothetical protein